MTPGLQGAENGPMSAYFPDHPLIPKNTCPEGAKTPRVKLIGEVGPLPPFLAWTNIWKRPFSIEMKVYTENSRGRKSKGGNYCRQKS